MRSRRSSSNRRTFAEVAAIPLDALVRHLRTEFGALLALVRLAAAWRRDVDSNRDEASEGRYANFLEVGRNTEEIVMDFGQVFEDEPPMIHTRIVTHPRYARRMAEVLQESLAQHQARHGRSRKDDDEGAD